MIAAPSAGSERYIRGPQAKTPSASVADSSPFRPLDLPTSNNYRTGSGRPGRGYWQQRVDYNITATLDPARNELHGSETIHYANHAPEALPYLWLFVEQNICAPNSVTNQLNQPPLSFLGTSFDFSCQGFKGGCVLDSVRVAGANVKPEIYGTTMRIDLAMPLAAGAARDLQIAWHFAVPAQGAGRMGHDGPLYEMTQWFPRMAVYDDVRGWNHESYIGAGESAELSLTYDDGTRSTVRLPVEMWNLGPDFAYRVPGSRHVRRAEIDPRRALPDIIRSNNVWPRGG